MVIIKESHYLASLSLQGLIKFSFQGVTNFFGCSVLVLQNRHKGPKNPLFPQVEKQGPVVQN